MLTAMDGAEVGKNYWLETVSALRPSTSVHTC